MNFLKIPVLVFAILFLLFQAKLNLQPPPKTRRQTNGPVMDEMLVEQYSPLDQIKTGNIKSLKPAWTFQSGELKMYEVTRRRKKQLLKLLP
jgi:glucose dehydrogenase